jgi:hypothetical protein
MTHNRRKKYKSEDEDCGGVEDHDNDTADGFTSIPKEGVQRTFIALKNPSYRPGLYPRNLGPVANTRTITPPRRLLLV